jgi:hypothetical protein
MLTTRNDVVGSTALAPGETHFFLESLPATTFQEGSYGLHAEIQKEGVTLAQSRTNQIEIFGKKAKE